MDGASIPENRLKEFNRVIDIPQVQPEDQGVYECSVSTIIRLSLPLIKIYNSICEFVITFKVLLKDRQKMAQQKGVAHFQYSCYFEKK